MSSTLPATVAKLEDELRMLRHSAQLDDGQWHRVAALEEQLGDALTEVLELERAVNAYGRAIEALGARANGNDLAVVEPSRKLAAAMIRSSRPADAAKLLTQVTDAVAAVFGLQHASTATLRLDLGDALWASGQSEYAQTQYQLALRTLEREPGVATLALARALLQLGSLFSLTPGRGGEAVRLLHRALPLLENAYGASSRQVASVLIHLALAHRQSGEFARAISLSRAAANLTARWAADLSASATSVLAESLAAAGHTEEASDLRAALSKTIASMSSADAA